MAQIELNLQQFLNQLPDLSDEVLQRDYLQQPQFHNTLIAAMELLKDSRQALRLVELAFGINPATAARLAGAARSPVEQPVSQLFLNLVEDKTWRTSYGTGWKIQLLGVTLATWAVPKLEQFLQDETYQTAVALTQIATQAHNSPAKDAAIDVFLRGLQHQNDRVRSIVMKQLGVIGSDRAVKPLLVILKARDWGMRNHAAQALGEIGDPLAMDGLITASEDSHSYVRSNAITALGNLKATAALELLVLKLQDPDSCVRSASARALGKLGCSRAVERLILGLQDPDPGVRWTITEVLGDLGKEQALEALIQALQDVHIMVRKTALVALGKIGNDCAARPFRVRALEPLTAMLTNSDSSLRQAAIVSLQRIGGELPIQALLGDGDVQVRKLAVRALLNTAVLEQSAEPLLNGLQNPFSIVRAESAKLLGEMSADTLATIGIERVVNAIAVLLNDLSFKVRKIAVIALGKISSDLAIAPLISALQNLNNHRHLRRNAVFALEKIGTERVFHPITLALKDPIPCVRIAAVSSLARIGGERAIDLLLTALRDPYWQGCQSARYVCNALVKIGGVRVEEELLNALHNPNTSRFVRGTIICLLPQIGTKKSLDTLISLIANSRGWIKVMAISQLYQILDRALSDRDAESAALAKRSVSPWRWLRISTLIELLIATLGSPQAKVRKAVISNLCFIVDRPQYATYLEPIVPALAVAVGDRNDDVRRAALTSLAKIPRPSAFDFLIKALTHSDPFVAIQAVEGLGKILYRETVLKLSRIPLTDAQINLAISGLKTASTNSNRQVSKTAKEILTQLHI